MISFFDVMIIVPQQTLFHGKASSLVVPAEGGYLGILAHHAPLLASLMQGVISLVDAHGQEKKFEVNKGGFLRVKDNQATIILMHPS